MYCVQGVWAAGSGLKSLRDSMLQGSQRLKCIGCRSIAGCVRTPIRPRKYLCPICQYARSCRFGFISFKNFPSRALPMPTLGLNHRQWPPGCKSRRPTPKWCPLFFLSACSSSGSSCRRAVGGGRGGGASGSGGRVVLAAVVVLVALVGER